MYKWYPWVIHDSEALSQYHWQALAFVNEEQWCIATPWVNFDSSHPIAGIVAGKSSGRANTFLSAKRTTPKQGVVTCLRSLERHINRMDSKCCWGYSTLYVHVVHQPPIVCRTRVATSMKGRNDAHDCGEVSRSPSSCNMDLSIFWPLV